MFGRMTCVLVGLCQANQEFGYLKSFMLVQFDRITERLTHLQHDYSVVDPEGDVAASEFVDRTCAHIFGSIEKRVGYVAT
jgi:hypothetical protein